MSRIRAAFLVFVAVGGLAAATVASRDAFIMGFFFIFWGGASAMIAWFATGKGAFSRAVEPGIQYVANAEQRPFFDENGVHRFHGDVFDVENHPNPGAQGRV